jgi:hypothetical protein
LLSGGDTRREFANRAFEPGSGKRIILTVLLQDQRDRAMFEKANL